MKRPKLSSTDKMIAVLLLSVFVSGVLAYVTQFAVFTQIFNLLVFSSGLWLFVSNIKSLKLSITSANWVKTKFKISGVKISMRSGTTGGHSEYLPFFNIEYIYGGISYLCTSNDNLNFYAGSPLFYTAEKARHYLDKVESGSHGEYVLVNPKDPNIAFLRSGIARNQVGTFIFSLILMILPVLTVANIIVWQ